MSTDREASDLYRVRKTLCQMLNDRGYNIADDDLHMDLEEFKSTFSDGMTSRIKCPLPLTPAPTGRVPDPR